MKNEKVTKSWGVAAALIAAVICIAAAAVAVWSVAQTRPGEPYAPPFTIQWQPQSLLETRFAAKIIEDNKLLKTKLDELAHGKAKVTDDWEKIFSTTYLKNPRLWTDKGWADGWPRVLPLLKEIVSGSAGVSLDSVSALIEYMEYAGAETPKADIDAVIRIKLTFSASPGDNILEGSLSHRRVCLIEP